MQEPMSNDRRRISSVTYWQQSEERQAQRFYVAFCLLMSSIQDFMLGLKEREDHNLNWSATCSYYSLVHAGRLLTFLALGDFPTSHSTLRELLSEEQPQPRMLQDDRYPFNWLRDFTKVTRSRPSQNRTQGKQESWLFRSIIIDYLCEIGVKHGAARLETFGRILAAAAPLRNESNYEALLIAHEYQHPTVTKAFDSLATRMAEASESSIPLAIDSFNCFFRQHTDLPSDHRAAYESLLYDYCEKRISQAVRCKLRDSTDLEERLTRMLALIDAHQTGVNHKRLEEQISTIIFSEKAGLITQFESNIQNLAAANAGH